MAVRGEHTGVVSKGTSWLLWRVRSSQAGPGRGSGVAGGMRCRAAGREGEGTGCTGGHRAPKTMRAEPQAAWDGDVCSESHSSHPENWKSARGVSFSATTKETSGSPSPCPLAPGPWDGQGQGTTCSGSQRRVRPFLCPGALGRRLAQWVLGAFRMLPGGAGWRGLGLLLAPPVGHTQSSRCSVQ